MDIETALQTAKVTIMKQSDMLKCRFCIIAPEHYREDGSCKCDDPDHRKMMIKEWEYTAKDFKGIPLRKKIEKKIEKPKFTLADAGCWFDGARGIYIGEAVIALAIDYGFRTGVRKPRDGWSKHEYYCELWSEAEGHLDGFAPEGFWIGGNEGGGDFGMWPIEDADGDEDVDVEKG